MSTDAALERHIVIVLRCGTQVSVALMAVGFVVIVLPRNGDTGAIASLLRVGLTEHIGSQIALVGVAVLIATPIARVVLTFASLLRQRDFLFAVFNAAVLLMFLASLWVGHTSG